MFFTKKTNTYSYLMSFIVVMAVLFLVSCSSIASITQAESLSKDATIIKNKPHHTKTGFRNYPLASGVTPKGGAFYLRRVWRSVFLPSISKEHVISEKKALEQLNQLKGMETITWLGHASTLIRIEDKVFLTDPFLSDHASPVSWAGPARLVPPGISLKKLPKINAIIISHDHYDHLDEETIEALPDKENIHVFVPLGIGSFFQERGYVHIHEFDWKESLKWQGITITALPTVHDSGRSLNEKNTTLWCGWSIKSNSTHIYFAGDTAYSENLFKKIGKLYGPFNYALLPIGAYAPRELMKTSHITPEEAVKIGEDINATTLIAMHWGTIELSDEPFHEPPQRFIKAAIQKYLKERIWVLKIGESRALSRD